MLSSWMTGFMEAFGFSTGGGSIQAAQNFSSGSEPAAEHERVFCSPIGRQSGNLQAGDDVVAFFQPRNHLGVNVVGDAGLNRHRFRFSGGGVEEVNGVQIGRGRFAAVASAATVAARTSGGVAGVGIAGSGQ